MEKLERYRSCIQTLLEGCGKAHKTLLLSTLDVLVSSDLTTRLYNL